MLVRSIVQPIVSPLVSSLTGSGGGGAAVNPYLVGLLVYCNLDEASGARADSSGNGYHLTDNNTVTSGAGVGAGQTAAVFDAANNEFLSVANAAFALNSDFTISGWLFPTAISGVCHYFGINNAVASGATPLVSAWLESTDHYVDVIGVTTSRARDTTDPALSTWVHLIVSYDITTRVATLYRNNGAGVSGSALTAPLKSPSPATLTIGRSATQTAGVQDYTGRAQSWGVWARKLTAGERTWHYNGGVAARVYDDMLAGSALQELSLSASEVEAGAVAGVSVGVILNLTSGSTPALIDDAGGRFQITGTGPYVLKTSSVATGYPATYGPVVRETYGVDTRDTTLTVTSTPEVIGAPDFWVDSATGNDTDSGQSEALAFATIGAVPQSNGLAVKLVPGGEWREMLNTGARSGMVWVGAEDPGDALATISAFRIVNPASWALEPTYSNTYKTTVANDITENGSSKSLIVEDDVIMIRVASIALVEATPGSFFCAQDASIGNSNPYTVYYHPTGSGDPAANGKVVEANARDHAIEDSAGVGNTFQGLHLRGLGVDDGCADGGEDCTFRRCLLEIGGKHHIVFTSGLLEDVVASRYDPTWPSAPSPFTAYSNANPAALSVVLRRVFATEAATFLSHFGTGTHYAQQDIEQCILEDMAPAGLISNVSKCYSPGGSKAAALNLGGLTLNVSHTLVSNKVGSAFQVGVVVGDPVVTLNLSQVGITTDITKVGSRLPVTGGVNSTVAADHLTVVCSATGDSSYTRCLGSMTLNRSLIVLESTFQFVEAGTFFGDNNVYVRIGSSGNTSFRLNGFNYTNNFAGWQTATGQDANSVLYSGVTLADVFLGDPYAGDLRINTATAVGAAIAARLAGVTEYWNFNSRSVVLTPPTRYPVGPVNLAEALAYLNDPVTRDFYP